MRLKMRVFPASLVLVALVVPGVLLPDAPALASARAVKALSLQGRWRVRFSLSGVTEKNLLFDSHEKGSGSFLLLDGGPDDKSGGVAQPAVWSATPNDRVSFSGELELQLGTCCRETGTLIFKGKFGSNDSVSGKAIFVGSTIDEENFNGFRSTVGAFTASRVR